MAFADLATPARCVGFRLRRPSGTPAPNIATGLRADGSRATPATRGPAVASTPPANADTADVALMMAPAADPRRPTVDLVVRIAVVTEDVSLNRLRRP